MAGALPLIDLAVHGDAALAAAHLAEMYRRTTVAA